MDLFEILFIMLFVLIPIMEQVLKKRRKGPGSSGPSGPGSSSSEEARSQGEAASQDRERESASAADMVPEDLWAVLTGEAADPDPSADEEPEEAPWQPEPEPWWSEGAEEGEESRDREPISAEYRGPEAYSLETYEREAVSLEADVPSPEARHRAFHELIDKPVPRRRRRKSALGEALSNRRGLRQAFVLQEVLGSPKGLD